MAWDGIRDCLVQGGVEQCAIFGKEDGSPWCNPTLKCSRDEVMEVKKCLENKDTSICGKGLKMCDKRWTVIKFEADEGRILLRGKDQDKKKTMRCCMTNACLIIGTSECEKTAEAVAAPLDDMQVYIKSTGL